MSRRRITGIIVTLTFGAITVLCAVEGVRWHYRFKQWEKAEPVRVGVDLSSEGTYKTSFTQTCVWAHGEQCVLDVTPAFESVDQWRSALKEFRGRIVIRQGDAKPVLNERIDIESIQLREQNGKVECQLLYFFPFALGDYEFTFTIQEPATGLAGRRQEIVASYLLCGGEYQVSLFAFVIAIAGGLITLLCCVILFCSWRRRGTGAAGLNE